MWQQRTTVPQKVHLKLLKINGREPTRIRARIDPATSEILIRGPNVFAGYENDDDANRDCFQEGWFRTGGLGRFDSGGYLFITKA